jgi:flagellar biosynthetic protein FliP
VRRFRPLLLLALAVLPVLAARAEAAPQTTQQDVLQGPPLPPALEQELALRVPSLRLDIGGGDGSRRSVSGAVEIVILMTLITLAPGIVMTLTSFTRIVIVLSFMRRAMAIQELPPNLVITGLAFFLSLFIMRPVLLELNRVALEPYNKEELTLVEAADTASAVMTKFLLKQTRQKDLELVYELSGEERPQSREDVPFLLAVPAFALSEVKTAFEMGFVLFLPFLVIDLVISAILIAMGMFTLPPVVISTPFKLLLFVLVDGWSLVIRSVAQSFA